MFNKNQKIGIVSPRYGLEIVGGAERHLRGFAEELHQRGYAVEVFTTTTSDTLGWNDDYPAGSELINDVPVHRFAVDRMNVGEVVRILQMCERGERVPYHDQRIFVDNYLNSQALYQTLKARQAEFACFLFAPYLFGLSYHGIHTVPDKAVLMPCLHDEAYAYFSVYREMFESVPGVIMSTEPERRFARQILGVQNPRIQLVGYGFDTPPPGDVAGFRQKYDLPEQTVLYVGRFEGGKNVPLLIEHFARYKAERPGPATLVMVGKGEEMPPARPDMRVLGFLSDAERNDAYAAAAIHCQPSVNESLSLVMMEAWLQGTPSLVNAKCAVTSDHIERCGGGWIFDDYASFRDALDQAFNDRADRAARGRLGCAYVEHNYTWDAVIERLVGALAEYSQPQPLRAKLARQGIRRAMDFGQDRFEDAFGQVLARAESDLAQGLSHTEMAALRDAAHVAMPEYRIESHAPLVGRLISWLRRNLTSHLREPYLDPIIDKQEAYNTLLLDTLLPALERSQRDQQRLERHIRLLEHKLAQQQTIVHTDNTNVISDMQPNNIHEPSKPTA